MTDRRHHRPRKLPLVPVASACLALAGLSGCLIVESSLANLDPAALMPAAGGDPTVVAFQESVQQALEFLPDGETVRVIDQVRQTDTTVTIVDTAIGPDGQPCRSVAYLGADAQIQSRGTYCRADDGAWHGTDADMVVSLAP